MGVDADDQGSQLGAQVVLYDIGDRSAPRRLDRVTYADAYSPVGDDHRAFLHWAPTGDVFVPLTSYGETYRESVPVVRVDGRRLQARGELEQTGEPAPFRRTFIVDDQVYALSWQGLSRHDLRTLDRTAFTPVSAT